MAAGKGGGLGRPEGTGSSLEGEGRRLASFASGVSREEDRGVGAAEPGSSRASGLTRGAGAGRLTPASGGPAPRVKGAAVRTPAKSAGRIKARRADVAALAGTSAAVKDAARRKARDAAETAEERAGLRPAADDGQATLAGTSTGPGAASLSDATIRRGPSPRKASAAARRAATDRLNDEMTSALVGDRESTLYAASGENRALTLLSSAGEGKGAVARAARAVKGFRAGRARLADRRADAASARATAGLMSADRERIRRAERSGASDEAKDRLKKRASRRVGDHIRSTLSAGGTVTGQGLGMRAASALRALARTAAAGISSAVSAVAAALGPWALPVAVVGLVLLVMFSGGWDKGSGGVGSVAIPEPYGDGGFTVTCYDQFDGRWASGTGQEAVCRRWHEAGGVYTDGIATIDGRYLVACTPKFGSVGDEVDFYLDDGTRIPCIIADQKNTGDEGCNEWGHDGGHQVLEFEVLSDYLAAYGNPGSGAWKSEWGGKRVSSATNRTSGGAADDGNGDLRSSAIAAARALLGESYTHANEVGAGFDCNGLCWYAWGKAGITIPLPSGHYTDSGQFQYIRDSGNWVDSESGLLPGDLVFYSSDGGASIFHVAMYIGDGEVIQSSEGTGVTIESLYWCSGFCGGGSPLAAGSAATGGSGKSVGWSWWASSSGSPTAGSFSGGEDYGSAEEWQRRIADAAASTPSPGAGLCATWVSQVYDAAGVAQHGGDGNTMLSGNKTSTDWAGIKVGQIVSAEKSGSPLGAVYGHVAVYVGGGKVMDNVGYIRTTTLEEWVAEYSRYGWVVYGWPW